MNTPPQRVVWAYDREHLQHPFIVMSLNSLLGAGFDALVVSADRAPGAAYASDDAFSFAVRTRRWLYLTVDVRQRLKQKIVEAAAARDAASKAGRGLEARRRDLLRRWYEWRRERVVKRAELFRDTIDTWIPYLQGFGALLRARGDVMVATRPEAAIWACAAAKLKRMRFVYFPFELYGEQIVRPKPLVAALERLMLRRGVDAVVTQNDHRAKVLRDERGARVEPLIVHNYKTARPTIRGGKLRAKLGLGPEKRVVMHEGMIVDGRWLEFLCQSVLHLPEDVVLVLMGQEKMKWRNKHAHEIEAALATGRLFIEPPVPHDDLPDYVADASAGVIIYDDTVRNNLFCEPGKLTDYISVGVPVVAPDFPTVGPVVRGLGLGECFEGHSPEAIARTIMTVLRRPRADWKPALDRACGELTWESQVPNLIAAVTGRAAPAPETSLAAAPAA